MQALAFEQVDSILCPHSFYVRDKLFVVGRLFQVGVIGGIYGFAPYRRIACRYRAAVAVYVQCLKHLCGFTYISVFDVGDQD